MSISGLIQNDRGGGKLVGIIFLAIVAVIVYLGFRIGPVYMASLEFKDTMRVVAHSFQARRDDEIVSQLIRQAAELGIPLSVQDIYITREPSLTIETQWKVTLDFPGGYSRTFYFHPIADAEGVRDVEPGE